MVYLSFTVTESAHDQHPFDPVRTLALDLAKTDASPAMQDLSTSFAEDWRQGLFSLGARRDSLAQIGAAHFWVGVTARYLNLGETLKN